MHNYGIYLQINHITQKDNIKINIISLMENSWKNSSKNNL